MKQEEPVGMKPGETIEIDGKKYVAEKGFDCADCAAGDDPILCKKFPMCVDFTDNDDIIFNELPKLSAKPVTNDNRNYKV